MAYNYHGKSADWQQEPLNKQVMDYIYSKIHVDYKYIVKSARSFNAINRNFIKYDDSDFEDYDDLDLLETKFEYKQRGRDLEKSKEWDKVIEYYNSLKDNYLFINDYYPYRRLCIIHRRRKDPEDDLNTIISFMKAEIYCNDHQLNWFKGKIAELTSILDMNADEINSLVEKYERNRKYYKKSQNTPAPIAERIVEKDGEVVREYPVEVIKEHICSNAALGVIQDILFKVVHVGLGKTAGSRAFDVSGKTGTAQKAHNGSYKSGIVDYLLSFCGYFPSEKPKYSCIVCIQKSGLPASGGLMSGQVFHDIAEGIMAKNIRYPSKAAKDELSRFVPDVKRGNILAADYVLSKLGTKTNGGWNGSYVTGNPVWGTAKSDDKEVKLEKVAATPKNQMPDVIGMGARDAVYILESRGMKVTIRGRGRVMQQSLAHGKPFKRGQKVELILN